MVYTKQLEMKLGSQRKIYNYLLRKNAEKKGNWTSWMELLRAKEIGLSKSALSRNLKEMLKPDAQYQLIKEKRPFVAKPLYIPRPTFKTKDEEEEKYPDLLHELYLRMDKKANAKIKGASERRDYCLRKFLKADAKGIENWSQRRIDSYLRKHKRLFRRKEYLNPLKKYFKQFERIGYSLKRPEIMHGGDLKGRPTDGSEYSIMRVYKDEKGNLVGKQFFRKLVKKTKAGRTGVVYIPISPVLLV